MLKRFNINIISTLLSMNIFSQGDKLPPKLMLEIDKAIAINTDISIDYFDDYLKKYPSSDYLVGIKAYFMCYNQSKDSAFTFLDSALKNNNQLEESSYINLARGAIKNQEGNIHEATKYFLKSIELDKEKINKWVLLELYYLHEITDSSVALDYLNKALKIDGCFAIVLYELSNYYYKKERFKDALERANDCIRCSPKYIQAYNQKALVLIELQKYDDAINQYNQVFKIDKGDIEAILGVAYIHQYFIKDHDLSGKYYKEALKIDANNFAACKGLGMIASERGECKTAIDYLQKAILIYEDNEVAIELLYCFVAEEKIDKAKELYIKLSEKSVKDKRILLFDILIDHLSGNKNFVIEKVNIFKKTQSHEDFLWLEQQLGHWNIDLIPQ